MLVDDLDGAETALDEATELLDGAQRLDRRRRCCRCGSPTSACAAATSPPPASSRCAPSRTPTCGATRACSSGPRSPASPGSPATSTSSARCDGRRRRPARADRARPPGAGPRARLRRGARRRSSRSRTATLDGRRGQAGARPSPPPWRRPTCRSSPRSGSSPPRSPLRVGRAERRRRAARRRGRRCAGPRTAPTPRSPPARALRAELGDGAFDAAYDRGRALTPRGGRRPAAQARRP